MAMPLGSGSSTTADWNPEGSGLSKRRLPFPAILAAGPDGARLLAAAREDRANGLKWPRRALELYFD